MRTTRSASKTAPEAEPFSAAKAGTPAPTGVKAPATTPATAGAATSAARAAFVASKNGTIDPTTLANKLAELAQDNDVTFELPFVSRLQFVYMVVPLLLFRAFFQGK